MEDVTAQLLKLQAEVKGHGFHAELRGPYEDPRLYVVNPRVSQLNEEIEFRDGEYHWSLGGAIGPADDVGAVAVRITHVLREPGPGHHTESGG